jgi:DNA-binding beta-propeller fold protein YncE
MRTVRPFLSLLVGLALASSSTAAPNLYWLDTSFGAPTINRSDPDGLGVTTLALGVGTLPEGLAVDDGGLLYWAEGLWSGARVMRTTTAFASPAPLVSGGSSYRGVALDDVAGFVYCTVSNVATGGTIQRSSVLGGPVATIVTLPVGSNPRGITVDHVNNRIYWADFGLNQIWRANLDGSSPTALATLPAGSGPWGIAAEPVLQRIFWTEYGTGQIQRLTNTGVLTLIISGLANPTYLALDLDGQRMYWAEAGAGAQKLRRANLSGSSMVTLPPVLGAYGGLAFSGGTPLPVPDDVLPTEFAIERVWPSPGRGTIRIAFSLPRATRARLSVIDLQGREVAVLAAGVIQAGRHEQSWNGRASTGSAPPGVYFVRMTAEGRSWVRRLVIIG